MVIAVLNPIEGAHCSLIFHIDVCCNMYGLMYTTKSDYKNMCMLVFKCLHRVIWKILLFVCLCVTGGGGLGGSKECDQ